MEEISEKQKQEFIQLRDNFHKKRDEIKKEIEVYESKIEQHNNKIGQLEEELKESTPLLEKCNNHMICESCEIYSMRDDGYEPGQGEHFWWYKCVICGYEACHT